MTKDNCALDANRHPLADAPGARPAGTGVDTRAGSLGREDVAQANDPTRDRARRSEDSGGRDCVECGSDFDHHGPAYGFGLSARRRYPSRDFDDVESQLSSDWATSRGASLLTWEWARHAAQDAWNRIRPSTRPCA